MDKIKCVCCGKQHEIKSRQDRNWHGDLADEDTDFAVAWCPEAGREVGDWIKSAGATEAVIAAHCRPCPAMIGDQRRPGKSG